MVGQDAVGLGGLCDDHQAGGLFVEAVDYAGAVVRSPESVSTTPVIELRTKLVGS